MADRNAIRSLAAWLVIALGETSGFAQEWRSVIVADAPAATSVDVRNMARGSQSTSATAVSSAGPDVADQSWLPEFLKTLPNTPDQPSSLFQRPAPAGDYACPPTNGRYLVEDPLLDPASYPQVGWFGAVETEIVAPHIYKTLTGMVTAGSRNPDSVALENRGLNWTAAPKVELGYRLPSGFGGFALSYRELSSRGNGIVTGPDGLALLKSRLALNMADLDYESWEFTPNDRWTMRWRFGGRLEYIYFDSVLNQSPDVAAAGSGILQQRATNMFAGFGPHASVELTRQVYTPEWRLLSRIDFASIFGRIKQNTSETAFDPASASGASWGETPLSSSQTSPQLNALLGLNWRPAAFPSLDLFVGCQSEYWWNVGRLSLQQGFQRSRGDLTLQGVVLRLQFNY